MSSSILPKLCVVLVRYIAQLYSGTPFSLLSPLTTWPPLPKLERRGSLSRSWRSPPCKPHTNISYKYRSQTQSCKGLHWRKSRVVCNMWFFPRNSTWSIVSAGNNFLDSAWPSHLPMRRGYWSLWPIDLTWKQSAVSATVTVWHGHAITVWSPSSGIIESPILGWTTKPFTIVPACLSPPRFVPSTPYSFQHKDINTVQILLSPMYRCWDCGNSDVHQRRWWRWFVIYSLGSTVRGNGYEVLVQVDGTSCLLHNCSQTGTFTFTADGLSSRCLLSPW